MWLLMKLEGAKMAFALFAQNKLQNAHILKLSSKMPLFWNSIFKKSSFNEKLNLMKIKLLAKYYMELEFHVIFFL